PVLFYSFRGWSLRFVGKKELFHYIVLVSVVFRIQRHARIDRKHNFAETMRQIELLGRRSARRGFTPAVFPEGTRARSGVVGPFHSGAVRTILRTAPIPVVSVAIDGGYKASRLRQFVANLEHLRYRVKVLRIYDPPKNKTEIDRLLSSARDEISAQIDTWRLEAPPK
ncbi:MAG TPA: lysophospholipid acyltransferase family protein, partial [Spirochaetia bacterium]|nr:lysophospholipid acyltransferase family protein [Spirochaetia bacterium]